MAALGFSIKPLGVQGLIHRGGRCALLLARKQKRKPLGILAPAFEAGPMAGSEGRDLVEEEQFRVAVAPDLAVTIVEVELAANPLFRCPAPGSQPTLARHAIDRRGCP